MPLTRPLTPEEDITVSIGTTISGLVAKYNGSVDAKALLSSIMGNAALGVNQLVDGCSMTFTEQSVFRGDLKALVGRALRAKVGLAEAPSIVPPGQPGILVPFDAAVSALKGEGTDKK